MASQITGVSSVCLAICWFQRKISKSALLALCEGNQSVTAGFPSQRASNAETVSIWWRNHVSSHSGILTLYDVIGISQQNLTSIQIMSYCLIQWLHQAFTQTSVDLLSIRFLRTTLSEILIKMIIFDLMKCIWKCRLYGDNFVHWPQFV